MQEPHIKGFVHHIHTQLIAGIQHGLGYGVMCRPNGIETVFFQNPDLSHGCFRVICSTQNAVVMVDTAAPEQCFLSVDKQASIAPGNFSDTEASLGNILHQAIAGKGYPVFI